jgi:acyl-coenzyme A thioesterase PaaI-like protein
MIAGPNVFTLDDTIAYFVTISRSPKGAEAFTASLSMEFLRPAPVGVWRAELL